jgi:predicted kinase
MEAVIFIGIQATGKSSFYRARFFNTHLRLSLDMLKTRHREDILLHACIEGKQSFVVDNTNPTVEERAKYIELARKSSFRVVGYYFQSRLEDAVRRNADRLSAGRIPERGIRGTAGRLQLPTFEEGFDALYYVYIADDGEFVVEEWNDEL